MRGASFRPAPLIFWTTLLLAQPLRAQGSGGEVRAALSAANLAPGYAQLLSLPVSDDFSAATYEVASAQTVEPTVIRVYRIPLDGTLRALDGGAELRWRASGGYLTMTSTFAVPGLPTGPGEAFFRWRTLSATGGLAYQQPLGGGFSWTASLDAGLARLENATTYTGGAEALGPILDGTLSNWQTPAWLATPALSLDYRHQAPTTQWWVRGHLARTWISTFSTPDPLLDVHEATQAASVKVERIARTPFTVAGMPVDSLLLGSYSGYFGPNRDTLGFTTIGELGCGLELGLGGPLKALGRVRLSGSYLFGPNLRGWTLGLSLKG